MILPIFPDSGIDDSINPVKAIIDQALLDLGKKGGKISTTKQGETKITIIDLEDRTVIETIKKTAQGIQEQVEITMKKTAPETPPEAPPYQHDIRSLKIDEKNRLTWPTSFAGKIPEIVMYQHSSKSLKLICTNNQHLKTPKGWRKTILSPTKGRRVNLSEIIGNAEGFAKILAHGSFVTVTPTETEDIDQDILTQLTI